MINVPLQVCATIHHPGYNRFTNQHDLAILRLCHPVTFDQASVAPACLPAAAGPGYEGVEVRGILTMVSTLYTTHPVLGRGVGLGHAQLGGQTAR